MRTAAAVKRGGRLFLHAYSLSLEGVWIMSRPIIALSEDCGGAVLGGAILEALNGSREGIPHPKSWSSVNDPLLRAAGVKSWKEFSKDARNVAIEEADGAITFLPSRLIPKDGSFVPSGDSRIAVRTLEPAVLGAELLRALTMCT